MVAAFGAIEYYFDGNVMFGLETWARLAPLSDSLFHPGPNAATGEFAKRIAGSFEFLLSYYQYFPSSGSNAAVGPTFGTSGLAQVMPQLMSNCPAGR